MAREGNRFWVLAFLLSFFFLSFEVHERHTMSSCLPGRRYLSNEKQTNIKTSVHTTTYKIDKQEFAV